MRGRKPEPAAVKRAKGNPGKRPIHDDIVVEGTVPALPEEGQSVEEWAALFEPPEELDPDARAFWREFVPALAKLGIVDTFDRFALSMIAVQFARAKQFRKIIDEEGLVSVGAEGQPVLHPAVKGEGAAVDRAWRMLEHYCGTPVARARMGKAHLEAESLAQALANALGG